MKGTVFIEELRRSWLGTMLWGLGMALLMLFFTAILQDNAIIEQLQIALKAFPVGLLRAIGISNTELLNTAEGLIAFMGFTYSSVILAVYGVSSGLGITANDEDEGSLNVLLSMPIHRWQIIVEKYLAYALMLLVILLIMFGGIALGSITFNVPINLAKILLGVLNLMPLSLTIMAVTGFIASLISRKYLVSGIAAAFVVASYFLNALAGSLDTEAIPAATILQKLSLFSYVDSESLVVSGSLNIFNIGLLLGLSCILVVISVFAFERRDIGG